MKTKLSEQEQFYARKNRRREWWGKNWTDFVFFPIVAVILCVIAVKLFILISQFSFQLGKEYDKAHHPQDWQHWHWETNFYNTTNIYYTNIYNRS